MNLLDLVKATLVCGGLGFLIYSFPLVSQIVFIALLSLAWLFYVRQTIVSLRRG